jgi:hypothetical protein
VSYPVQFDNCCSLAGVLSSVGNTQCAGVLSCSEHPGDLHLSINTAVCGRHILEQLLHAAFDVCLILFRSYSRFGCLLLKQHMQVVSSGVLSHFRLCSSLISLASIIKLLLIFWVVYPLILENPFGTKQSSCAVSKLIWHNLLLMML